MSQPRLHTPLRDLELDTKHGCRLLSAPSEEVWLDGSEQLMLDRVIAARDVSSWSDELAATAKTWPELYHLATARANVVRPFALDGGMRVLEIGAGCGAVTRHLGEVAGLVDALEPTPARARVLRARLRDLPGTEVYVGRLEDVPAEPAYDVVVVIGVLEYVGAGTSDPAPYVDFLRRVEQVLVPGGTLVLAIENRLGAKYLAGAPEDHTSRVFDSLEGYPEGSPARTFARHELAALFTQAELAPTFLQAFPDYKLPRVLMADSLIERSDPLTRGLPSFPSPDWTVPRPDLMDEAALWGTLVDAGLAGEAGNSFVVLGRKTGGDPGPTLWPQERLAAYWSHHDRRAAYVLAAEVVEVDSGLVVRRAHATGAAPAAHHGLEQRAIEEPVRAGQPFPAAWLAADDTERRRLVQDWVALLDGTADTSGSVPVDLVPRNLHLDGDQVVAIDQEWWSTTLSTDDVVQRGVVELAEAIIAADAAASLAGTSLREVAAGIARATGVDDRCPLGDDWVRGEAALQGQVLLNRSDLTPQERGGELERSLRARLEAPAPDAAGRLRAHQLLAGVVAERDALRRDFDAAQDGWRDSAEAARAMTARAEAAEAALAEARAELDSLRASVTFRVAARAARPLQAVLPPGSPQRSLAARAVRRGRSTPST